MSENEKKTNSAASDPSEKSTIQFSDLWKGLLKYWWVLLALGVAVSLFMFFTSYSKFRPIYKVSATFTVNTETVSLTGEGLPTYSYYYDNATASNLADTFPYILQSEILTEAIAEDLGLRYVPAALSAQAVSSTNMFTLTAIGGNPQQTYDVLVSAMKHYPDAAKYLVGNVRLTMITEPQLPKEPTNKFTYVVALKGFAIGFALGAAWILLYAVFRKTVRTKKEIKQLLHCEVVGTLPEVTFKRYKKQEIDRTILIRNERIGKGFLESVRVFRNSFIHMLQPDEKVVMMTSTAPGEGKTTALVNLALSLADAGKRVLLVDADLRNPSVAPALGLSNDILTFEGEHVFYKTTQLEDFGLTYLRFTDASNAYWKVVKSDYLKEVFDALRDEYDYILVDTPPCGLVSDTSLIAQAVDAIVYVVLQDTVRVNKILGGMDSVSHSNARLLGVVMNGAQSGFAGYGENYGYSYGGYGHYKSYSRYGYGYGYGYGYEYGGEQRRSLMRRRSAQNDESQPTES